MATILVVDDLPAYSEMLAAYLRSAGMNVLLASHADAGTALSRRLPDLIIVEVPRPDVDGLRCLERLQANQHAQNIPLVAILEHCPLEFISLLKEKGAAGVALKSASTLVRLFHQVQRLLETSACLNRAA